MINGINKPSSVIAYTAKNKIQNEYTSMLTIQFLTQLLTISNLRLVSIVDIYCKATLIVFNLFLIDIILLEKFFIIIIFPM